jgi:hypothetical protein
MPGKDSLLFIVKDEIPMVRSNHQNGMPLTLLVDNHCHPQGALGQACIRPKLALEQLDILAIT